MNINTEKTKLAIPKIMQCSILIHKLVGNYWKDVQCKNIAKYDVKYKISKNRDTITTKKCCAIHKTKLLKEIENDSFAEFVSVDNIKHNLEDKFGTVGTEEKQLIISDVNNLAKFCEKISQQEDCPPEFTEIVNKEFWKLI